jgi:CBS domain-containing protein
MHRRERQRGSRRAEDARSRRRLAADLRRRRPAAGILTDRDIAVRCIAEGHDPAQLRAGDLAQETLFWVEATADVGEVLHQMEDHRVKHLPVIENHRLVGIITEVDLARNLDEHRLAEFVEKVYTTA